MLKFCDLRRCFITLSIAAFVSAGVNALPQEQTDQPLILMYSQLDPSLVRDPGDETGLAAQYLENILTAEKIPFQWEYVLWENQHLLLHRNNSNVCGVMYLHTIEREEYLQFVGPIAYATPIVVIGRADDNRLMQHQSIEAVIKDKNLRTSLFTNTSYTKRIDALLENNPKPRQDSSTKRVLRLIEDKHIDYAFVSESVAVMAFREGPFPTLTYYKHYAESQHGEPAYMACAKRVPKSIINTINKAMAKSPSNQ